MGNTRVNAAVYEGANLIGHWGMPAQRNLDLSSFAVVFGDMLSSFRLGFKNIDSVIISSVVPSNDDGLKNFCTQYLNCKPLFINHTNIGMKIAVDNPPEVGADRLVVSFAAYKKYKRSLIVIDLGTAITFDCIDNDGVYLGGPIAPGIGISSDALFYRAEKLFSIEIQKPERVIGRNTTECVQSGIFHGYVGLIDHVVAGIKQEMNSDPYILATGGWASLLSGESKCIHSVDEMLLLDGLRDIYSEIR